jgi:ABC-type dipeptide/oligopeptide/nickel transport system ATPase component
VSTLLEVEGLRVKLPTPTGLATVVDGVDYQVEQAQVFGVSRGAQSSAARTCSGSGAASCAPSLAGRSGWSSRIR